MSMADLDEFGYWWVYDLTPQQLEKYNGPNKRPEKPDKGKTEEKAEEIKKELTKALSTSNWVTQTDQDAEPNEITTEEAEIEQDEKQWELEAFDSSIIIKKDLVEELSEEKIECPFPNHRGYLRVRKTLTPKEQKEMKENIKITDDGKIEIIKMHKKFSILSTEPDGRRILNGDYRDRKWCTWLDWVTYLDWKIAERICREQWKKLLENEEVAEIFIDTFPWKDMKSKIINFFQLFGLRWSNCWHDGFYHWIIDGYVDSHAILSLSSRDNNHFYEAYSRLDNLDNTYAKTGTKLEHDNKDSCLFKPFIAFEDC